MTRLYKSKFNLGLWGVKQSNISAMCCSYDGPELRSLWPHSPRSTQHLVKSVGGPAFVRLYPVLERMGTIHTPSQQWCTDIFHSVLGNKIKFCFLQSGKKCQDAKQKCMYSCVFSFVPGGPGTFTLILYLFLFTLVYKQTATSLYSNVDKW